MSSMSPFAHEPAPSTALPRSLTSRRIFLAGGAAAVLAACSSGRSAGAPSVPASSAVPPTTAPTTTATPATTAAHATSAAPATTSTAAPTIPVRRQAASRFLSGNYAPVAESTALDLPVTGVLPEALQGTLFRQGPNPLAPSLSNPVYSWFGGEGMVHTATFEGGRCRAYRSRSIRTNPVAAALGEAPVSGPTPLIADLSNTSVGALGGMILSTTEGSIPYVIDTEGNTLRRHDFGGKLTHGLSAHPKWDPVRKELHNVSYGVLAEPYLVWQVIDGQGNITRTTPIDLPASTMVHTMSLTDTYVVIYDLPVEFDANVLSDGWVVPYRWKQGRPARLGIIPRDGQPTVQWIEIDPCYVFHDQGAHDTATGIEVTLVAYDRVFDTDLGGPTEAVPRLERWSIDLAVGRVTRTVLDDRAHEFPRVNDRVGLTAPQYLYTVGSTPTSTGPFGDAGNLVVKHDLRSGSAETVSFGTASTTGEAVFVADPERSDAEDGGWLISFVYDAVSDTSQIAVVDAADITAGPVASVQLPTRVPSGFHGTWVPA